MRSWVVALAVLGSFHVRAPLAQTDDAARVAAIRERVILSADVLRVARLAAACGRRDAAWSARGRAFVIARQTEDADRHADEVEGGREAVRWMMLGARIVATSAADAEHDRYGEFACRRLDESGDLADVDALIAPVR